MSNEILDGKEEIILRLDREDLFQLMLMAHEQDVTLNQLVENILRGFIEEAKNKELLESEKNSENPN